MDTGWEHPGVRALTLAALCVEVNAARRVPWTMPKAIQVFERELDEAGIASSAKLAEALRSWEFLRGFQWDSQDRGDRALKRASTRAHRMFSSGAEPISTEVVNILRRQLLSST